MPTHAEARSILKDAYRDVYGSDASLGEAQFAQAVAWHETGYGMFWKPGAGAGSHNWGAIQGTGNAGSFTHGDTHADGTPYTTHFAAYSDDREGAKALIHELYQRRPLVRAAALQSDFEEAVKQMRSSGYFEASLASYVSAVNNALQTIGKALGESIRPLPSTLPPPPDSEPAPDSSSSELWPTLRFGSHGDAVKRWQAVVEVEEDGIFGKDTLRATRAWQLQHGLVPDGVVGPKTWAKSLQ